MEPEPTAGQAADLRRDWRVFWTLAFLFNFGFAVNNGVFQNFFRTNLNGQPMGLGLMESMRELPGLLAALTAGMLMMWAESRVAAIGLAIAAVGIGMTGLTTTLGQLIAISVFWSVGFHLYSTVEGAITLALARGKEGGRHLGIMSRVGNTAVIGGLGLALLVSKYLPAVPYWAYFAFAGACILAASTLCARLSPNAQAHTHLKFVIRREYALYYVLIFLEGCRRQIFGIFATFVLIREYHQPLTNILALQFVNAMIVALAAPTIGRYVDRRGERNPLTFYAIGLVLVYIGYATIKTVGVLYALYIVDHVLFIFGVGFTTYLHRIARPGEFRPCLAMGVTMNHIAAVTVPLGGAYLWQSTGNYVWPFWVGMGIATLSMFVTRLLPAGPRPAVA